MITTRFPSPRLKVLRRVGWALVAVILLLPAVAMPFTDDVQWTASDFAIAAVLLIGAGLLIELAVWKARSLPVRLALCLAVLGVVGLIWVDGAVGLFH